MFKKSDYHHLPKNKKGNDNYLDSSGSESDKHAKNKKPGFKFNIFRSKSNSSSPSKRRKIKKSKLIKTSDLSSSDSDSSESSSPGQNANLGYKTSTYSHRSVGISKAKSTPDIAKDALCRSDYDIHPLGLRNVGNTCFFNSVIQCIVRIPPLVNLFLSKRYKSNLNKRNRLSSGGEISNGFYDLLMRLSVNNPKDVRWIDPSKFRSVFVKFYSRFDGYDEQDAQEFLLSLIDGLHEDMNSARPSHLSGGECDPWAIFTAQNVSPIYDLFRGKTESKISCSKCKHISIVKEGFIALSLPLPGHRFGKVGVKLEECLTIYCADEVLDGSNKVMCEGCKKKTISKKKTTIEYSGQFLILCLKRFAEKNGKLTKNDIKVSYPSVLRADVFSKDGSSYKLIGCVYHLGSLDGGHYTSSAIDQNSGRWFYFNDSRVTPITEADAHRDSAYILFYQKI
ncbi:Ubiquitin carboxyl-terminal hydrolase 2 [Tritrichomonas foetus]|uniref:ubiquitinyl hydrolase 1 n=1 Tax=Tritrichomonas foetus TaxID=1144522 RepID=A0A1J4JEE8_9EUKA|nr:Ubiquitin carboxyl-terminal hydrolase 2 [Tritrichomonas foetus]|eukprot:OHS95813.1 Ubiquitin carboxyl-terminal hydrolase 2 [Tritrichomonas foetus]